MELGFKFRGVEVLYLKILKIGISILDVDNDTLLALIFLIIICIFSFEKKNQ